MASPTPPPDASGVPAYQLGSDAAPRKSSETGALSPTEEKHTVAKASDSTLGSVLKSVKNSTVGLFARSVASSVHFHATSTFDPGTAGNVTSYIGDKLGIKSGSQITVETLKTKASLIRSGMQKSKSAAFQEQSDSLQSKLGGLHEDLTTKQGVLASKQQVLRKATYENKLAEIRYEKAEKALKDAKNNLEDMKVKYAGRSTHKELKQAIEKHKNSETERDQAKADLPGKTETKKLARAAYDNSNKEVQAAKKNFDEAARKYDKFLNEAQPPGVLEEDLRTLGKAISRGVTKGSDFIDERKEKGVLDNYSEAVQKEFERVSGTVEERDKITTEVTGAVSRIGTGLISKPDELKSRDEQLKIANALQQFVGSPSLENLHNLESVILSARKVPTHSYLKGALQDEGIGLMQFEQASKFSDRLKMRNTLIEDASNASLRLKEKRQILREEEQKAGMTLEDAIKLRAHATGAEGWEWNAIVPKSLQKAIESYEEASENFKNKSNLSTIKVEFAKI